ncbi:HAMP domain-containing protein [bacterium SCSIO 12696]|nr:HAMP domain-containing protein [bacterium SCSIO 12696]
MLWFTSSLVVVTSSGLLYVELFELGERIDWNEAHQDELQGLIAQYERYGSRDDLFGNERIPYNYGLNMQVFDADTGIMIYGIEDGGTTRWQTFDYISGNGRSYQVQIPRLESTYWLSVYRSIQDVTLFRWLLTLMVSGAFSVFLALLIIRPVKRLRSHIDIMGSGELDTRLDRNLTSRRDEFGNLARSFNDMADHIQQLVDSKQQLLHDVSHELRAPLARLQVAGELARCEAQAVGVGEEMYDRVDRECVALNKLIDEILTLSKAQSGNPGIEERRALNLSELVGQVVADARFLHTGQTINLNESGRCKNVVLSPGVFEKAFKNILENALKYGQGNPVDVSLDYGRRRVTLVVADRGPGMSEQDLKQMFTPFYRAKAYNSKEGYGLGMSITLKAVQQMNGDVQAVNRPGGGLQVSLVLPYKP